MRAKKENSTMNIAYCSLLLPEEKKLSCLLYTSDLNYDKYFKTGDTDRNILTEFNSNNTELLDVEQVKEKLLMLSYIRDEIAAWEEMK